MATTPAAAGFIAQTETGKFEGFTFSGAFFSGDSGSGSDLLLGEERPVTGIGQFGGNPSLLEKITFEWSAPWTAETTIVSDGNAHFEANGQFSLVSSLGNLFAFDEDDFSDFVDCESGGCISSITSGEGFGSETIPNSSLALDDLPVTDFLGTGFVSNLGMDISFAVDQSFSGVDNAKGLVDITLGEGTVTVSYHVVPLPAAAWLMISGLAAMGGLAYRLRPRATPAT